MNTHIKKTKTIRKKTTKETNIDKRKQKKKRDSPLSKERNEAHSIIAQSETKNPECAMNVESQDTWPKTVLARRKEKESHPRRKQRSTLRDVIAQMVRPLRCGSIALVCPPMQQNQLPHTKPNHRE